MREGRLFKFIVGSQSVCAHTNRPSTQLMVVPAPSLGVASPFCSVPAIGQAAWRGNHVSGRWPANGAADD